MTDRDRIVELEAAMKDITIRLEELEKKQKGTGYEIKKVPCDGCKKLVHPDDEAIPYEDGEKFFCSERCADMYYWRKKRGLARC